MPDQAPPVETIRCPECGAEIPREPRWVTWCERCDWNLAGAPEPTTAAGKAGRAQRRAQERGRRLYEEMLTAGGENRGRETARVMTYVFAVLLHLPALALALAAVLLVTRTGFDIPAIALAAGLLALAFVMRPRFGRVPKGKPVARRRDAPSLFALVDEISNSLGAHSVEWIAFEMAFNCGTGLVGLRRRRLIVIGLPLWTVLSNAERVALLTHEVAHDINGDLAHGLVVSSALQILSSLVRMLTPGVRLMRSSSALVAFAEEIGELLLLGLRGVCLLGLRALLRYRNRASPRAEYLADQISAPVAGRDAAVAALDKMYLEAPALASLKLSALRGEPDLWERLDREIDSIPPKERERRRRLGRREGHQVDETHPPTAFRIDVLSKLPPNSPSIVISDERAAQIDREIAPARKFFSEMLGTNA